MKPIESRPPYIVKLLEEGKAKMENGLLKIKKIKVCILVNTLTSVNSFVYSNHIEFFVWHAKNHPEIEFIFFSPHRMSIDSARNTAADYAFKVEADYLMFLDDDVMVPKDCLWKLIQDDKDICAGLVMIRGYPFNVMAFKFKKATKAQLEEFRETGVNRIGFYNDLPKRDGKLQKLVKCDAVGFSLCLIKTKVLKEMQPPFFMTGTAYTEDVYFCVRAKAEVKDLKVFMDTSIECGHMLDAHPVAWSNKEALKKFQETVEPVKKKFGRNRTYFSQNLKNLK